MLAPRLAGSEHVRSELGDEDKVREDQSTGRHKGKHISSNALVCMGGGSGRTKKRPVWLPSTSTGHIGTVALVGVSRQTFYL